MLAEPPGAGLLFGLQSVYVSGYQRGMNIT